MLPDDGPDNLHRGRLALVLTHEEWFRLLTDDWLQPTSSGGFWMGIGQPVTTQDVDPARMIVAWINPMLLADIRVSLYSKRDHVTKQLTMLCAKDIAVFWPGPAPLFAVEAFSVISEKVQEHLFAAAAGFSNTEIPAAPCIVEALEMLRLDHPVLESAPETQMIPPADWDALRGAATMAVSYVPGMSAWINLLCLSLLESQTNNPAKDRHTLQDAATNLNASWLGSPPWFENDGSTPPLWNAMLGVLRHQHVRDGWRPKEILAQIQNRLCQTGDMSSEMNSFFSETSEILSDRRHIDPHHGMRDPLGLSLQLLLLRPKANQFVSWRDELAGAPPSVWWTGAMLSGLVTGFRDLQKKFRGQLEMRRILSLVTWITGNATNQNDGLRQEVIQGWLKSKGKNISWTLENGKFCFRLGDIIWFRRVETPRGKWSAVDLSTQAVRAEAVALAQSDAPFLLQQELILEDTVVTVNGEATFEKTHKGLGGKLAVKGKASIVVPTTAKTQQTLISDEAFRHWLCTAPIARQLSDPPSAALQRDSSEKNKNASTELTFSLMQPKAASDFLWKPTLKTVPGLSLMQEFISGDEEKALLATVDAADWDAGLKRRVQHYGWRYDYQKRRVNGKERLGPLPTWAQTLAERLFSEKLVPELPDQVIVNEYCGRQSIAAHVDCLPCFRGPIVTISLNEAWEMVFQGPNNEEIGIFLPTRSAAIMDGESRTTWKHKIAPRLKDKNGIPRVRRISLTFRKINLS